MTTDTLDLTACDKEKIHLISSVQGHGTFLSLHRVDLKIRNVSENLSDYFDLRDSAHSFVGKRLNDVLPLDLTTRILEKLRAGGGSISSLVHRHDKGMLDVHLYPLADDLAGIEFEFSEDADDPELGHGLNSYLERMQSAPGLSQVSDLASKAIRFLTGFDRVMIYRFFPPTMYGEVIGEDRVAGSHSFLHHRFPATDIPKPARDLYLKNKVRYIHDSAASSYPVYPQVYDKKVPLDMSDSRLRSVSLVHLEYLKNMGVRGSMSVAIIVAGSLWGIIACHHPTPLFVNQSKRRLCLQVANTLAMVAPLLENVTRFSLENAFYSRLHDFFNEIKLEQDPMDFLFRSGDKINPLFRSEGLAFVAPDKIVTSGLTPRTADVKRIWDVLRRKMTSDVFETMQISSLDESFLALKDEVAGILAVRVSPADDSMLIFLRPEFLREIFWGGDPRKNLEARNYHGQINPRASFDTWTEVVKGASLPWMDFEIKGARQFRNLVFDSLVRKEQLIQELHERLRSKHQ